MNKFEAHYKALQVEAEIFGGDVIPQQEFRALLDEVIAQTSCQGHPDHPEVYRRVFDAVGNMEEVNYLVFDRNGSGCGDFVKIVATHLPLSDHQPIDGEDGPFDDYVRDVLGMPVSTRLYYIRATSDRAL